MRSLAALVAVVVLLACFVSAQNATCPLPPLQTTWPFSPAIRNGGRDFGAPDVPQGKIWNGQPKKDGPHGPAKLKNLILIIPDGFGPASEVFARDYNQWSNSRNGWNTVLGSDTIQIGSIRTRSSDSWVTDSAASATAYSCAIKTYNGAIGIDEDGNPCGTVLEAAKAVGYHTGLVVTSRITHATPAAFASHVYNRDDESVIAKQLVGGTPLGPVVDILLGGGVKFFLPNTTKGSGRSDDIDVFALARKNGYYTFTNRTEFDNLQGGNAGHATKPYLGLFTADHMSYELDRDNSKEPSLLEMTKTAIRSLERVTRDSDKGFFLMVEASRIDHAGHGNDLAGHLHEILMYNEVVDYLKEYIDSTSDETLLLGTADHECGGLTLGGIVNTGEYQYNVGAVAAAKHTSEFLGGLWNKYNGTDPQGFLLDIFSQYGITDANSTEIAVANALKSSATAVGIHIGQSMNRRALTKWGTLGHSAVDVNLIGYATKMASANLEKIRGNHDNTEVGLFIANELRLDLPSIAGELNDKANEKWLVEEVGRDKVENGVVSGSNLKARAYNHEH